METNAITAIYAEFSGLPTPVSAHLTEEQVGDQRVYTLNSGEIPLLTWHNNLTSLPSVDPGRVGSAHSVYIVNPIDSRLVIGLNKDPRVRESCHLDKEKKEKLGPTTLM